MKRERQGNRHTVYLLSWGKPNRVRAISIGAEIALKLSAGHWRAVIGCIQQASELNSRVPVPITAFGESH